MKYARLVYGKNNKQMSVVQYANLGDYFQTFAIDLQGITDQRRRHCDDQQIRIV